jgi:hypothetical protein
MAESFVPAGRKKQIPRFARNDKIWVLGMTKKWIDKICRTGQRPVLHKLLLQIVVDAIG